MNIGRGLGRTRHTLIDEDLHLNHAYLNDEDFSIGYHNLNLLNSQDANMGRELSSCDEKDNSSKEIDD